MSDAWNHNIHYHGLVLAALPPGCARALDVGCGTGVLTRALAMRCGDATGMDLDEVALATARATRRSMFAMWRAM